MRGGFELAFEFKLLTVDVFVSGSHLYLFFLLAQFLHSSASVCESFL